MRLLSSCYLENHNDLILIFKCILTENVYINMPFKFLNREKNVYIIIHKLLITVTRNEYIYKGLVMKWMFTFAVCISTFIEYFKVKIYLCTICVK